MRKLASCFVLLGLAAMPAFAAATSFENVPIVDVSCSKKAAADPDAHTRTCALACVKGGFGIVTKDHGFLKFDAAGNAQIVEALKATSEKDHLRVDVNGDVEGDTLKVSSIKLL